MKPGRYRHYKGGEYDVLGICLHTETGEKLVLYKAANPNYPDIEEEYGKLPLFVRPYEMFGEEVETENGKIRRFEFIK